MMKSSKVVAIVQARMDSTRLPGKVLMELGGQTTLARVVARLSRSKRVSQVVIATTTTTADEVIVKEAERNASAWFRGSEQDVLSRYLQAAEQFRADRVVRITSDCPLVDPGVVDRVISEALSSGADFASNCIHRTYPRGLDTEVFTLDALRRADDICDQPHHREHVTPIFYERPDLFRAHSVTGSEDYTRFRWTLDTPEDLELIRAIYSRFDNRDDFGWREVVSLMEEHPELTEINSHVIQKAVAS
jgi:spore coat polysaccharide biosynthesis protein SpsF